MSVNEQLEFLDTKRFQTSRDGRQNTPGAYFSRIERGHLCMHSLVIILVTDLSINMSESSGTGNLPA